MESINAIRVGAGGGIPEAAKIIRQEQPTIDSRQSKADPQQNAAEQADVTVRLSPQAEQRLQAEAEARKQAETLQNQVKDVAATAEEAVAQAEAKNSALDGTAAAKPQVEEIVIEAPPPPPPSATPEETPQAQNYSFYEVNEQRRAAKEQSEIGEAESIANTEYLAQVAAAQEAIAQTRALEAIRPETRVDIFA